MEPLAVSIKDAARLTSLSARTIRRYIKSSRLRAIYIGSRCIIPMESIRELLRGDRRANPIAPPSASAEILPGDGQ
jgi:excisionase family DNA binding protein